MSAAVSLPSTMITVQAALRVVRMRPMCVRESKLLAVGRQDRLGEGFRDGNSRVSRIAPLPLPI
jgi:hypothetical protein